MKAAITITEAARLLGKHPATIRRWIQREAPCVRPGSPGRGKGALVDVEALECWRKGGGALVLQHDEWLSRMAEGILTFHRERAHRIIALRDAEAAAYLHDLFQFIARRTGSNIQPHEISLLHAIAQQR